MYAKRNIKCEISYDGTNFHGFQIQPNQRTVQGELQATINKITKQNINVIGSGRTDAGVHARKQVCNFIVDNNISIEKWQLALNSLLPEDIVIIKTTEVPLNFNSRFDVKEKVYRYTIYNNQTQDVFRRNYSWHYKQLLNIGLMKKTSQYFIGKHDFTAFSSAKSEVENKVRTIYSFDIWQENNEIYFQITGNGFLYNMVRIIVGTLVDVSRGKIQQQDIANLLINKDRNLSGITAPAKGLFLWDVIY